MKKETFEIEKIELTQQESQELDNGKGDDNEA